MAFKIGLLMKTLLLLCYIQHSVPFGLAGSDIRAGRAPIAACFLPSDTRRFGSAGDSSASGSSGAATDVDNATASDGDDEENKELEQNTKYVKGLIDTLEGLCDKWIVTGNMGTRRRAYNLFQQIDRLSKDKELPLRAERLLKRCGMPMGSPPPIPPTEHVPAVDQQQQQNQPENSILKPMGAMAEDGDGENRKSSADERLAWEQQHKEKSEFMNGMSDNKPRSALSARMEEGDPFLNGVMEGSGSPEDLVSFEKDKKDLQNTMNSNPASSLSTSDISANVQSSLNSGNGSSGPGVTVKTGKTPRYKSPASGNARSIKVASAKNSEFIARAGSGDAFTGAVLGVGGLDDVLAQIQRRVWIPLAAPPSLLSELGIQPVRGLLLYGAPGCGKTLLARKLGSILSPCRPITIVSGPEILDKFVGSSEKNLRELFDEPPELYHEYKKNYGEALATQALHVIVLDEFDAIARRRGGSGGKGDQGDAGVARDSVVNQLLAKMDGVDGLGVPTLLVGLTNKPSLIDQALMRPGRFEVQIEVPKPRTVEQRIAILKVHTESMVKNGRVLVKDAPDGTAAWKRLKNAGEEGVPTYDELLDILAIESDGMSGASLAGVARAAASRALERAVTDFAGHIASGESTIDGMGEGSSISDCLVTQSDFEKAVEDVFDSAKGGDYTEMEDTKAKDDKTEDTESTSDETEDATAKTDESEKADADASDSTPPPL